MTWVESCGYVLGYVLGYGMLWDYGSVISFQYRRSKVVTTCYHCPFVVEGFVHCQVGRLKGCKTSADHPAAGDQPELCGYGDWDWGVVLAPIVLNS